MTGAIDIRTYLESDEESVVALWNDVLADPQPHNDPRLAIRKKLEVQRDLFFVAVRDGEIVGTVMGGYDGHRGWIYLLGVKRTLQRQGIGEQLVRHIEAELAYRGCVKINLQVRATNAGVIAFYEKLGFIVEDRAQLGKRLYEA